MKILQLHLNAFGPFTDTVLDFSAGHGDLHMIYGLNEAGKSSALRALRQLLFGIPVRSTDNFLHPHPRMRIGARLACDGGAEVALVRRKGQSKTLRLADDHTVLDEGVLAACLGGVDEAFFNRMFAIGHDDLIRGGLEIVSGGGDVGQALFAAGSGLIRLREVRQQLIQAGDALFKPGGTNPTINQALAALREARKAEKEAILPGSVWQSHDQALRAARSRIAEVRTERECHKQAHARLERIRTALPLLARRAEIQATLTQYGDVPVLPADFAEQRRTIETTLHIAEEQQRQADETMGKADEQINTLVVPDGLLAQAEAIEALQQDLGSVNKAEKDRPQLATRMRILEKEAASLLAGIGGPMDKQGVRQAGLTHAVVGAIQKLGNTYERLTTKREAVAESRHKLTARVRVLTRERRILAEPDDVSALKAILEVALGAVSMEPQLARERIWLEQAARSIDQELQRQTLWAGARDLLETLAVPPIETIDVFEARLDGAARRIDQLENEKVTVQKELARITTDLKGLEQTGSVPTEADLSAARALRNQGWHLIRAILTGDAPGGSALNAFTSRFDSDGSLPDAFARSMTDADGVADRLRREADRSNRKGIWLSQQEQATTALAALDEALAAAAQAKDATTLEWHRQWVGAGIIPRSPKEMRAWVGGMTALRQRSAELRERAAKAAAQQAEMDDVRDKLYRALTDCGQSVRPEAPLAEWVPMAKALVAEGEQAATERATIDRERSARVAELEEATARGAALHDELDQWKIQWGRAVGAIGLDAEDDPAVAATVIDAIRQARAKFDEADTLRRRIEGIDRDADTFSRQVAALIDVLAPDLKVLPPPAAAAGLNARLATAREAGSKREALGEQRSRAESMRSRARQTIIQNRAQLEVLCRQARCADPRQLPDVEARGLARERLAAELYGIEEQLRTLSAGATVTAFAADAATVDPDTIHSRMERLEDRILALDREHSHLDQTIGTEKNELARMDGNARAAQHAEAAEHLLARIEADIWQYARLRLAGAVLSGAIERYRERNQGPLIQRAGELFADLTLGAFSAVRAEYDDKGQPVLVGIRPGAGELVRVEGMSDGTADQLYLALRLAGLEQYLDHNTPLPFVVDDILLRFDDRRSAATLEVLADLSRRTQVICFTHHRHLVELAKRTDRVAEVLQVHRLTD